MAKPVIITQVQGDGRYRKRVRVQAVVGKVLGFNATNDVAALDPAAATFGTGITAFAGGGQGSAVALASDINYLTTVASRGDSVLLPVSGNGAVVYVINGGVNPAAVFPQTGDTINGLAANASVLVIPNETAIFVSPAAGKWYVENGMGVSGSVPTDIYQDNITAHAGGGQGSAFALTSEVNRVTTVATAGDSVALPPSGNGLAMSVIIINHGANNLGVFGSGTDTINDVATATGVLQMPFSTVMYFTLGGAPASWYSESLATGFSGGYITQSFTGGITAHAGGGQGAAVLLTSMVNRLTTVATAGDSVLLPAAVANISIGPLTVCNSTATSANVFPNGSDQINGLGASAAFALAGGKNATFYSTGISQWHAVLSA